MLTDHLVELVGKARERVRKGYYATKGFVERGQQSLVDTIVECEKYAVIAEIKYASPSAGTIREPESALKIAQSMLKGGACAISVLTDPDGFRGQMKTLAQVSKQFDSPIVMKDIVISPTQLKAGAEAGADAVVLIAEVFSRNLAETGLDQMIAEARSLGLEVLVEAHSEKEFAELQKHDPDLYGINNRDLSTFELEVSTTERILGRFDRMDRPVVSESGISSPADIKRLAQSGANAFLVGTSIMKAANIEERVKELVYT